MDVYDLYGVTADDLSKAQKHVERALSIVMEERESSYLGDYSLFTGPGDEEISLIERADPIDGELHHPDFPDYTIFLQVDESLRADVIKAKLAEDPSRFTFLRRKTV